MSAKPLVQLFADIRENGLNWWCGQTAGSSSVDESIAISSKALSGIVEICPSAIRGSLGRRDDVAPRIWNADTGDQIGTPLGGHERSVRYVKVSLDGRRIVSSANDDTIRIWPGPAAWPELLCDKLTANMSRPQWKEWVSPDIDYMPQCPGLPIPGG